MKPSKSQKRRAQRKRAKLKSKIVLDELCRLAGIKPQDVYPPIGQEPFNPDSYPELPE